MSTASSPGVSEEERRMKGTIDHQLDGAPMFLSRNCVEQDYCVVSCVHFSDDTDEEGFVSLFYSVIVLQRNAILQPE